MRVVLAAAAALMLAGLAFAFVAAPAQAETVWLCKPGVDPNPCRDTLETTTESSDGSSRVENPPLPADPPVDCFYVYPTVSEQAGVNANKDRDPELDAIARYQASRFSAVCDVYAPIYRQLTLASIAAGTPQQRADGFTLAYSDVLEAWRAFLAERPGGRGFMLVGHSQGTRMLRKLAREEVDPAPALRRKLVGAYLLGGNVLVRDGRRDGGDFQEIPACAVTGEVGCVVAYSTFNETPPDSPRFGKAPATDDSGQGFPAGPEFEVLCNNPASLAANARTELTSLVRSEPFPGVIGAGLIATYGGPPPTAPTAWLRSRERYTGACVQSNGSNVLMLESVGAARKLNSFPDDTWGVHLTDVNIALGDLIANATRQSAAYRSTCKGKPVTQVGTVGADVIRGTSKRDVIAGLSGNDRIVGLAGGDLLCGGSGRDRLYGGSGRDRVYGGKGRDVVRDGPGPGIAVQ